MFSVELVNATGGGNIGVFPIATITVVANDGPYGVVAFSAATFATSEVGDNETSSALLTLTRRYHIATGCSSMLQLDAVACCNWLQ